MNVFIPDKAKVRVFVDSRGKAIIAEDNILPTLEVEVVLVKDGEAVCTVQDRLPDSLPFSRGVVTMGSVPIEDLLNS